MVKRADTPRSRLCRSSRKATPNVAHTVEAWWYEETRGITVYCRSDGGSTLGCFISARALESFLAKRRKK